MELEFKGTKGEWHIKEKCASILDDNGKSVLCWNGVATSTFEEDEVVLKANSKLIAAAPNLLAALQETLKEFEYALHNSGAEWMPDYDKRQEVINQNTVVVKAKSAIEKALK